jgi:hypothetical protein
MVAASSAFGGLPSWRRGDTVTLMQRLHIRLAKASRKDLSVKLSKVSISAIFLHRYILDLASLIPTYCSQTTLRNYEASPLLSTSIYALFALALR